MTKPTQERRAPAAPEPAVTPLDEKVVVHARQVEMWTLDSLKPYDRNARSHPPAQIDALAKVIADSGFTQPLLIEPDGTIIGGHGRLQAAQQLGMAEVPVVVVEGLTPTQLRALRLSDNKLALLSDWNPELLKLELADLRLEGFDVTLSGFELVELADLGVEGFARTVPEVDVDDIPDVPADPVSQAGDLWVLGDHRIICGSSTEPATVEALLQGDVPHLMVTDPPYGVEYDADWRNRIKRKDGTAYGSRAIGKVLNDDEADWRAAYDLFPGDVAYVWCAGLTSYIVAESMIASRFDLRANIIWNKNVMVIARGHYHYKHEVCWYAVRKGGTGHWQGDRTQTSVWDIAKPQKSETGHSTQKPVECMRRPILNNSETGDLVYEPFSGSGTTIIAAQMTGRRCRAVELNPAYVDIAVLRWEKLSGQTAVHADGRSFAEVRAARLHG